MYLPKPTFVVPDDIFLDWEGIVALAASGGPLA
jgi:hypothetical protein